MLDLIVIVLFIWLSIKAVGLTLKITWGIAKILASMLIVIALPALIVCIVFASGIILLAPVLLLAVAIGILKSSI